MRRRHSSRQQPTVATMTPRDALVPGPWDIASRSRGPHLAPLGQVRGCRRGRHLRQPRPRAHTCQPSRRDPQARVATACLSTGAEATSGGSRLRRDSCSPPVLRRRSRTRARRRLTSGAARVWCALRPRQGLGARQLRHLGAAAAQKTTTAPAISFISRLNHTACALPVYASQPGLPPYHARLASPGPSTRFGLQIGSSPGKPPCRLRQHSRVSYGRRAR